MTSLDDCLRAFAGFMTAGVLCGYLAMAGWLQPFALLWLGFSAVAAVALLQAQALIALARRR